MGELDLASYATFAIASLILIVVFLLYLLFREEAEMDKLRQDAQAKQAISATDETKLETAASSAILNRISLLDQNMEARFKELGTQVNASNAVEKLRQEIETRFSIRFDKEAFTDADLFSFLFTVSQALYRFDNYTKSREGDENLRTEARGYIAVLRLAMAWARANGNEMVRKEVTEILPRAEAAFRRMNEL